MVGKVHWAWEASGHKQVLRHLHERHRRMLWIYRTVFDRPRERRAIRNTISDPYNGGHGTRTVPTAGQLEYPEAIRERWVEYGGHAKSGSWNSVSRTRGPPRQYQWLCTQSPIQHCHEAHATTRSVPRLGGYQVIVNSTAVLMMDPNWARGFYYDGIPPHGGMKLAREIATVTYRSGPEWEQRFGRRRADPSRPPALCPDFLIETYLDHAGEKWCLEYDPNSLLYVSKAMDLFDLGQEHRNRINEVRKTNSGKLQAYLDGADITADISSDVCSLTLPDQPYEEKEQTADIDSVAQIDGSEPPADLVGGLRPLANTPTLVLGVASDILFPAWQQREIATTLKRTGNKNVTHIELGEEKSMFGHDTFLLDLQNVGGAIQNFLG
jgi:homoserine acetyltransferase